MTIHSPPRHLARNAQPFPKFIHNGETVRLTLPQIGAAYARLDSLVLPEAVFDHLRKQNGPAFSLPKSLVQELIHLNPDLGPREPQADPITITTGLAAAVIIGALLVGFAVGYGMSEAADTEGSAGVEVTNNEGDVTVCPDGGRKD